MVPNPRATPGPGPLRPLNLPQPVAVETDAQGAPVALIPISSGRGRRVQVAAIDDRWRIDDEWWRQRPVARMYYRVTTEEGRPVTIFQDLVDGAWYRQPD